MKCNEVLTCIYFEYIVYRWVFLKRRVHTTAFILHIRLSNSKLWIRFHGICEYTLLWYVSRNRNERHFGQQTVYLTDFKMEEVLNSDVLTSSIIYAQHWKDSMAGYFHDWWYFFGNVIPSRWIKDRIIKTVYWNRHWD